MKTLTIPNETLIPAVKAAIDEGHSVTLRVRGRSMRPFLEDNRDKAVLSPIRPDEVKRGDVVLAEVKPSFYVLHRVARRDGDNLTLRGDGNPYLRETCRTTNVIAIATGFLRGKRDKFTSTTSFRWKFYSFVWPSWGHLRRLLLAIYSRIKKKKKKA